MGMVRVSNLLVQDVDVRGCSHPHRTSWDGIVIAAPLFVLVCDAYDPKRKVAFGAVAVVRHEKPLQYFSSTGTQGLGLSIIMVAEVGRLFYNFPLTTITREPHHCRLRSL